MNGRPSPSTHTLGTSTLVPRTQQDLTTNASRNRLCPIAHVMTEDLAALATIYPWLELAKIEVEQL